MPFSPVRKTFFHVISVQHACFSLWKGRVGETKKEHDEVLRRFSVRFADDMQQQNDSFDAYHATHEQNQDDTATLCKKTALRKMRRLFCRFRPRRGIFRRCGPCPETDVRRLRNGAKGRRRGVLFPLVAPKQARTGAVPIVRRRGRGVTPAGACVFSRLRKECRREWSRGWAGIPAHRRPPSLPAARIPRRRSLPGCRGTCRRKWRRCPRR